MLFLEKWSKNFADLTIRLLGGWGVGRQSRGLSRKFGKSRGLSRKSWDFGKQTRGIRKSRGISGIMGLSNNVFECDKELRLVLNMVSIKCKVKYAC